MKIFGLTGGIASGKTTVAERLRQRGIRVVDADQMARRVVEPGQPALREIAAAFGEEMLLPDGTLDRKKLGAHVFASAEARATLENITHPRIREATQQALEAPPPASLAVVEAALMIETGWAEAFDGVAVVHCPEEEQLRRLLERDGWTPEQARERMDAQMDIDDKAAQADFVLDNSGPPGALDAQVDKLVDWMRAFE